MKRVSALKEVLMQSDSLGQVSHSSMPSKHVNGLSSAFEDSHSSANSIHQEYPVSTDLSAVTEEEHLPFEDFDDIETDEVTWSVFDEKRLASLDNLHFRSREYHNNVHTFSIDVRKYDMTSGAVACNIFHAHEKLGNGAQFRQLQLAELEHYLVELPPLTSGVLWIHILDKSCITRILQHFGVHYIFHIYFTDLRAHASYIEAESGFFLSLCSLRVYDSENCLLDKFYAYITHNLCITYGQELMPQLERPKVIPNFMFDILGVLEHRLADCYLQCCKRGPAYLLFLIVMEFLAQQDPLLDFCSRSIFFYRNMLSENKRGYDSVYVGKVRVLESCLVMLEKQVKDSLLAVQVLTDHIDEAEQDQTTLMGIVNPRGTDNFPYLEALLNAYQFIFSCIENELSEARVVHADMNAFTSMAQSRTALTLSLVATVFLPLTFLAGLFGTNFQYQDSQYTIPMLNDPNGPLYFTFLCITVTSIVIIYFIANGWLRPYETTRSIVRYFISRSRRLYRSWYGDPAVPLEEEDGSSSERAISTSESKNILHVTGVDNSSLNGNFSAATPTADNNPRLGIKATLSSASVSKNTEEPLASTSSLQENHIIENVLDQEILVTRHKLEKAQAEESRRQITANYLRRRAAKLMTGSEELGAEDVVEQEEMKKRKPVRHHSISRNTLLYRK